MVRSRLFPVKCSGIIIGRLKSGLAIEIFPLNSGSEASPEMTQFPVTVPFETAIKSKVSRGEKSESSPRISSQLK